MNPLGALLLDIDNTVYAYAPCHAAGLAAAHAEAAVIDARWSMPDAFQAAYDAARRSVKANLPGQAASHCRLLYFKRMFEMASGRTDSQLARQLHDAYWRGYFAAMRIDAGCAEALAALRAAGVRLAWVTDFTTERQMLKLNALGLHDAADFLVTSEEAGAEKPDPRMVDMALARLGVAPSRAWLLGDSLARDVAGARARGLTAVWFKREPPQGQHEARALAALCQAVVSDWPALRRLCEAALE